MNRLFPETAEQEQRRMQVNQEDLERYKQLGVLEVFTLQGEDDEDVEVQFMNALFEQDFKTAEGAVYVVEPAEERIREGLKDNR